MAVARNDPYSGFNFLVEIDGLVDAGFSEISGLGHEIAVIEYREGSDRRNAARKLPGLHKVSDLTLKRGLAGSLSMFRWLKAVRDGQVERRQVAVILMDEMGQPVMRWQLQNAWPCKLTHGPLSAAGDIVAIEEMVLAVETIEFE
ncbi:MAG: phage tail protein [Sphingomonas sp.]|nr:MAG: phage tail protein [Sphingomonas sp.]